MGPYPTPRLIFKLWNGTVFLAGVDSTELAN